MRGSVRGMLGDRHSYRDCVYMNKEEKSNEPKITL